MHSVHELLEVAIDRKASDLILKAGIAPALRIDGQLVNLDFPALTSEMIHEFALEILFSAGRDHLLQCAEGIESSADSNAVENRMQELRRMQELNLAFTIPRMARVRAHLYMERCAIGAALRLIALQPPTVAELGMPPLLRTIAGRTRGIALVAGPMGMGKTTTLAALIEEINVNRQANVVMIEEPIEYLFQDRQSVIHQREIGQDTWSKSTALNSLVRQSPDVVALGELRDASAIETALNLASEGCLVLGALQCSSVAATLDRIIGSFSPASRAQNCHLLAEGLLWITAQALVPRKAGVGRIPAVETLPNSTVLQAMLREAPLDEILDAARKGEYPGMTSMNQSLDRLCRSDLISAEVALRYSSDSGALNQILRHN